MPGWFPALAPILRSLRQSPAFSLFVIFTLAIGISANTAIFSVADAFLFKPVSFPDADRLLSIHQRAPGNTSLPSALAPADFLDFQKHSTAYQQMAAYQLLDYNLVEQQGDPETVYSAAVTANFFDTLAMKPALGRTFAPGEDQPGNNHVVILSHGIWLRHFGGAPDILGRKIKLNGNVVSVIGVMGREFRFPVGIGLWTPMTLSPQEQASRDFHTLHIVARLKAGVTESQARAELETISAQLAKNYPLTNRGWGVLVQPLRRYIIGDFNTRYSSLLLGAVFFVLLIACANVMSMQLARITGRQKEFAVRAALGAGRWRIVQQIVAESVVLSLAGALVSLLLSSWSLHLLLSRMPAEVSRYIAVWDDIQLDGRALGYTVAVAVLAGILSGLVPSLRISIAVNEALKEGGRGTSTGRRRQGLRSALVVAEIAAAMVLLAGAGLMVKGSQSLIGINRNLHPESILAMQIVLSDKNYGQAHQRASFYDRTLERLATLPGVEGAALSSNLPSGDNEVIAPYTVEGQPVADASQQRSAQIQVVSPNYFDTVGIPVIQGRGFQDSDGMDAAAVAIVSENFARRHWPGQNALGRHVRPGTAQASGPWLTVVGVVKDVRYNPFVPEIPAAIYQPYRQAPAYYTYIALRTKGDPLAQAQPARRAIAALDIHRPLFEILTLDRVITNKLIGLSYVAVMLTMLGAIAIVLAAAGIYGLMAYSVSERTHEIGIRLALGAARPDVLAMLAWQGFLLTATGLGIGLAISISLARLLSSLILGVDANDLSTFSGTALLLAVVALLACYLPARRALAVDPIIALRYE